MISSQLQTREAKEDSSVFSLAIGSQGSQTDEYHHNKQPADALS